jgi:threonylcarbamoyladenosine tRNA methylthiotransferase MtaB
MKIGFYTLGCKLNQTETEAVADGFRRGGREPVGIGEPADLYIVNTCTVTSKSEQKARRVIRQILKMRPGKPVIVTGCYAELEAAALDRLGTEVYVLGLEGKDALLDLPGELEQLGENPPALRIREIVENWTERIRHIEEPRGRFRFQASRYSFHSRAFMKVQDGCDNSCSYCRVRLARGPSVSVDIESAISRFKDLQEKGYEEVVLTGVNLTNYRWEKKGLDFLLERLLSLDTGIRIRLSSIEPDAVSPGLLEVLKHPSICPHFHLPLQSGADGILSSMRRRYTTKQVIELVEKLRRVKDRPFIAADLIVGFPGESKDHHGETLNLLHRIEPADLHVFPFSPRPGTSAALLPSRVPERIARERAEELRDLAKNFHRNYSLSRLGNLADVLLEEPVGEDAWMGLSEMYLPVHIEKPVGFPSRNLVKGKRFSVRLTELRESRLCGKFE